MAPSLDRLPGEISRIILGQLRDPDLFILGRTSSRLRRTINQNWPATLAGRTADERLEFWGDVAHAMPDLFLCERCHRLHHIDRLLGPQLGLQHGLLDGCRRPLSVEDGMRTLGWHGLTYAQVQLALKYRRLGDRYSMRLQSLTEPYTTEDFVSKSIFCTYKAEVKIVEGHFFLHDSWSLEDKGYSDSDYPPLLECERPPHICPHLLALPAFARGTFLPTDQWTCLTVALLAQRSPAMRFSHHCSVCAADVVVVQQPSSEGGQLCFQAWRCFGSEGLLPTHPLWKAHLGKELRDREIPLTHILPLGVARSVFETSANEPEVQD